MTGPGPRPLALHNAGAPFELSEHLQAARARIEPALAAALGAAGSPEELIPAMAHSLLGGGKRLRPILVLAAAELDGPCPNDPLPAACAVELVHTYSLIHDDLPAMDDDDYRRGQPTCHKIYGEALAILAGDGLLTEAFALLARSYGPNQPKIAAAAISTLAQAAGPAGMVGGQVLDTVVTGRRPNAEAMERVHRLKTGALITGSLILGAHVGQLSEERHQRLRRYGEELGLAFQIVDDLLDLTGDLATLGKQPGSDVRLDKATYPALFGPEGARAMAETARDHALGALDGLGAGAEPLRALARYVVERSA